MTGAAGAHAPPRGGRCVERHVVTPDLGGAGAARGHVPAQRLAHDHTRAGGRGARGFGIRARRVRDLAAATAARLRHGARRRVPARAGARHASALRHPVWLHGSHPAGVRSAGVRPARRTRSDRGRARPGDRAPAGASPRSRAGEQAGPRCRQFLVCHRPCRGVRDLEHRAGVTPARPSCWPPLGRSSSWTSASRAWVAGWPGRRASPPRSGKPGCTRSTRRSPVSRWSSRRACMRLPRRRLPCCLFWVFSRCLDASATTVCRACSNSTMPIAGPRSCWATWSRPTTTTPASTAKVSWDWRSRSPSSSIWTPSSVAT